MQFSCRFISVSLLCWKNLQNFYASQQLFEKISFILLPVINVRGMRKRGQKLTKKKSSELFEEGAAICNVINIRPVPSLSIDHSELLLTRIEVLLVQSEASGTDVWESICQRRRSFIASLCGQHESRSYRQHKC